MIKTKNQTTKDNMKRIIEETENQRIIEGTENQGLESLLGERIQIMSAGYFYEGKLTGVNETCVELNDAHIIYETGSFQDKVYKDIQKLHTETWFVSIGLIESFGLSKCE